MWFRCLLALALKPAFAKKLFLQLPPSGLSLSLCLCHLSLDDTVRDCLQSKQCRTSNGMLHTWIALNVSTHIDDYHVHNDKQLGPTYLMQHDEINNSFNGRGINNSKSYLTNKSILPLLLQLLFIHLYAIQFLEKSPINVLSHLSYYTVPNTILMLWALN